MDRALQVREILATRGLTLYNLSRQSGEIFGRRSPFCVPHNLYYDLARPGWQPTIGHILALSHITNYRLPDWLAVFGFDLDAILRLQLLLRRKQTTMLDSAVYDTDAWVPWFAQRPGALPGPAIAPLGQFLTVAPAKRARDLLALGQRRFLYARVGEQDPYALPYFVPGSIIRVDAQRVNEQPIRRYPNGESPFFLVQHDFGLVCTRLVRLGKDRVLLHCPQRPCAERELHIGRDAKILGMIDSEIRRVIPSHDSGSAAATVKSAALAKPRPHRPLGEPTNLRNLVRDSRLSAGLTFREGSMLSRLIANELSNELYFAASGTLSDYETLSAPPRHIEKILALCLLYSIGFDEFLRASGLPLERAGREPIPDELIPRKAPGRDHDVPTVSQIGVAEPGGFIAALVNEWEEVPLFLRFSLDRITGLKGFSLSDLFWVGGDPAPQHPLLLNAALIAVSRRARKPSPSGGNLVCYRSLYLVLRRDGRYVCGRCTLDEGNLVLHGYPGSAVGAQSYKNGEDAEVVGQVTTILRRLL